MHRHIKAEAPLSSHSCDDSSSGVSNLLDPACSWLARLRFLLLHLSVWGPVIVGSLNRVRPCDWKIDILGAGGTKKKKMQCIVVVDCPVDLSLHGPGGFLFIIVD